MAIKDQRQMMLWALGKGLNPGDPKVRAMYEATLHGGTGEPGKRGRKPGSVSAYRVLGVLPNGEVQALDFSAPKATQDKIGTAIDTLHKAGAVSFRVIGPGRTMLDSSGAEVQVFAAEVYSLDLASGAIGGAPETEDAESAAE